MRYGSRSSVTVKFVLFFFFNDTATTEIYTSDTLFPYTTLFRSHDASIVVLRGDGTGRFDRSVLVGGGGADPDARIQPNAFGPDGHDVRTPRGVSFADTNRDGLLDIVTTLDHMSRTAPGGLVTPLADRKSTRLNSST